MSQLYNAAGRPIFRLLLLGPASLVDGAGELVAGMAPGKPLAMLAYLVMQRAARREELVSLLWPEMPEDRARNAFRQTLHRLRGALGQKFLATDREVISVDVNGGLWCDATEFQQAASSDPERAITLYRGPFLGGLNVGSAAFEQWTENERDRIEAQYRGALTRAANESLDAGRTERAAEHARTLSRIAPLDAEAAILEAKALVAAGRKPEAVAVLTQHVTKLESDLAAKPAASVRAMLQRLVSDAPAAGNGPTTAAPDLLPEGEFVGRERELGTLLGIWRGIEQNGAFAVLTGPPGIGKTRLLREAAQRMAAFAPALVLWGQERHGNRTIPYAAIADALRPAVNAPGVAGASQHLLAEAARLLPEIRDQFNLPESRPLEDDAARIRFFEGIASLVDAVAFEQPVCLVLEDLQHASRSSIDLLQFLTQRLAAAPIFFLASYRPSDSPRYLLERFDIAESAAPESSGSRDGARRAYFSLPPLEIAATKRLLESVVSQSELDGETVSSIAAASEGNPFRALDLARRVRRGEPIAKLPVDIAEILWARLQSCSPHEQRLFLAIALLGRPAPLRILAAATHLPEPAAFDAAVVLEQRGLIVQRGGGVAPAHDVVVRLALEGTGSAGRALLAGWTADALASEPGASNAELAQLYAAAGQPSSAHAYARAAVLEAAASGAGDELNNLLVLAQQTAMNKRDRASVDSLRTALQGSVHRLPSGGNAAGAASAAEDTLPSVSAGPLSSGTSEADDRRGGRGRELLQLARRPLQVAALVVVVALASAALLQRRMPSGGARGTVLDDSVLVAERVGARDRRHYVVTGPILPAPSMTGIARTPQPPWLADLALPWANPMVSPDGQFVALERITARGTDVYVMSASARDTIPLAVESGDDLLAGWSPDGRWVLVIHGSNVDGLYRSVLHAYSLENRGVKVPLDTSGANAVVDAIWSPTGMHVAWTARTGPDRQRDLFVGVSDGTASRNVTMRDSEEYHPAWSPDGQRLVFTSDRDGDAELYSLDLAANELRRLTFDLAHDDLAVYSPNGDFIAFESTRGGYVGVYAMPPLGGSARRLTPAQRSFELLGWRGRPPGFIAQLRVTAPATLRLGASAPLSTAALDQYGAEIEAPAVEWEALDNTVELIEDSATGDGGSASSARMVARRAGIARMVAKAGAWRSDTAFTLVGSPVGVIAEGFADGLSSERWSVLGEPRPVVVRGAGGDRGSVLMLRSDRQWESGVLGRSVLPLRPGLSLRVRVRAPFSSKGQPGGFTLALVAAEATEAIDPSAPQFLKLVALSWLPDAGRLAYTAEREFWSEAVRFARGADWHSFRIEVEADGRVAFYVEDRLRRRSSIVVTGKEGDPRVQLWIGGRATGDEVLVDDVELSIADVN